MEPGDKFQEHFRVAVDVAVSAKERPQPGTSFPWQGFTGKSIGPKILFTTKEEQEEMLNQYGQFSFCVSFARLTTLCIHLYY